MWMFWGSKEWLKWGGVRHFHGLLACRKFLLFPVDFGPDGVRINAICPGFMVHEQNDSFLRGDPGIQRYFREQYPVGRVGTARDIANAVWFLCSDMAGFITGQAITVDVSAVAAPPILNG